MNIITDCTNCVFVKTDENNVQTGCSLGRIDKYLERGVVLELADNRFRFLGRSCLAKRHIESDWVKEYGADIEQVWSELTLKADIIILIEDGATTEGILRSAESAIAQTFPAQQIHFVLNTDDIHRRELASLIRDHYSEAPYNMRVIEERNYDGSRVGRGRIIDITVQHLNPKECGFYLIIPSGQEAPLDYLARIDTLITQELDQALYITYGGIEAYFVPLHITLMGNSEADNTRPDGTVVRLSTLKDKLAIMATDFNGNHLLKDFDANNYLHSSYTR